MMSSKNKTSHINCKNNKNFLMSTNYKKNKSIN